MATKKKAQSSAEKFDRARAASARARERLAENEGSEQQIDIATAPLSWWRERWHDKAIRRTFIENFIYIRDLETKKLVLLKFNDMQDDLDASLTGKDVNLKMRKGGSSTVFIAKKFANAVVMGGRTVRIFAHNPKTEAKFRRDVRTMYRKLPAHLKPQAKKTESGGYEWHDDESGYTSIETMGIQPGFEDNARGDDITDVLVTEMPYMRGDTRTAITAILEACTANADISLESTAGGIDYFHSLYQDGKNKRGGWTSHFYQWWWRRDLRRVGAYIFDEGKEYFLFDSTEPDATRNEQPITSAERKVCAQILYFLIKRGYLKRGAKWYAPEVAEYLAWRRAKIEERGEQTFFVEYPENDKDCFEATGRPVISPKYLQPTCKPSGPIEGHAYIIGADSSLGLESGDPAAIGILDVYTGAMAHLEKCKLPPDRLAIRLGELSDEYNGAMIVPERNSMGIAVILKLIDLGYEDRLYKHLDTRARRAVDEGRTSIEEAMEDAQYGFPTTQETKRVAGMKLEEGVRTGALGISSEEFCEEAKTVVWFDNGSFGALPGYHDDQFIAVMIAWYVISMTAGVFTGFIGVMPEAGYAR